jgi:hypothetical protein
VGGYGVLKKHWIFSKTTCIFKKVSVQENLGVSEIASIDRIVLKVGWESYLESGENGG